jgi:hypothetical protein
VPTSAGAHPQPTPTAIALRPPLVVLPKGAEDRVLPPILREPTVTAIAAGAHHALAIADGVVYSWGNRGVGALGRPVSDTKAAPGTVALPDGAGAPIAVAAASWQSFVTTSAGQAYGFGSSDVGQLGNPGLPMGSEVGTATPTPVAVPAGTTLSRVFAGDSLHTAYFGGGTLGLVSNLAVDPEAVSATAGRPLDVALTARGGDGPYAWAAADRPAWLTLDPATGALRGTPPAAGAATFTASVTDRFGTVAAAPVTVTVAAAPSPPPPPGGGTSGGGTPGAGGGTVPAAPAATTGRVRIARLTHAGGTLKVTLACAGGPCRGKLAVTRRVKRRTTTYATKTYTLRSGTRRTLTVTINKSGARLLRHAHRLAITLRVKPAAGGARAGAVSRKLTLKPAKPKRRR